MLTLLTTLLALQAEAAPASGIHFLGVTSTTRSDTDGLGTLNNDCAAVYPRSRICTDVDIMSSFPAPVVDDNAWIMMTVAAMDAPSSYGVISSPFGVVLKRSSSKDGANCSYASSGGTSGTPFGGETYISGEPLGVVWSTDGLFEVVDCGESYVVACCGP